MRAGWGLVLIWLAAAAGLPDRGSAQSGASAAPEEGRFFRVHPLGFVEMEVAEATAKAIVGAEGTVVPDRRQQRLLVRATESEHRRLADALAALNRPPPNIRIDVEFDDLSSDRRRGASVSGGGVFGPGVSDVSIGLSVEDRTTRAHDRVRQSLVVASGREALLRVGERVPYLAWLDGWGRRAGLYSTEIQWEDVGAFLAVEPTLIGEGPEIRIRLIPELSGRVAGRPHRIRFAAAATEVIARAGEPISLGGLARDHEFYSRFLVGADRGGSARSLNITLTPTLLAPPR